MAKSEYRQRRAFRFPVTTFLGSTPWNFIRLLRMHHVERKFYIKVAFSFLLTIIFTPFNFIEDLILRKRIRKYKFVERPIFIVGFMRSGTTLLHNLLCQDPSAGYATTFQAVFPHCVITQKWWLKPFTNIFLPSRRPFDNVSMDMDFPQEDEYAMINLQPNGIYKTLIFPKEFNQIIDREYITGSLPQKEVVRWKQEYRKLVIKSIFNTKGTRYIGKNPHHIPRLAIVKSMFPDAGFIFIHRDPYVVVESLYNFILSLFPGVQLQKVPPDFSRENIARLYSIAMQQYFKYKTENDTQSFYEIKMEEFISDKIGGLKKIYSTFDMKGFNESLPAFEAFIKKYPCARHEGYNIHEDTIRYVNLYAIEMVTRLGYSVRNGEQVSR